MLTPQHIWLAREPVDMRRGIDTLTQYITDNLHQPWQGDPQCQQ
ncbi:IS66 Orf2 like protein [Yersinia pseudotuberculosis]|nr:IS66 Orf2 like protein [Yersinia pseudotuberculosis]